MAIFEAGREASLLQDIIRGDKVIECRLNRDKFAKYRRGDQVWLRADTYVDGKLTSSEPKQVLVQIGLIEHFPTFRALLKTVGFKKAVPRATDLDDAVALCHQFYTPAEEEECGVLAIHFHLVTEPSEQPQHS